MYYFFPDGKAELLQAVVKSLNMDPEKVLADLKLAQSLEHLVELINRDLPCLLEIGTKDIHWLHHEADQLSKDEKVFVHDLILEMYKIILIEAQRFIPEADRARRYVWMMTLVQDG